MSISETNLELNINRAWSSRWSRRLGVPASLLRAEIAIHPNDPRKAISDAIQRAKQREAERPCA